MTVYILCPANRVTGGIELAHQMCHAINILTDIQAKMWYLDIDNFSQDTVVVDSPAPDEYLCYKTEHANDFWEIDKEENVIVFPEGITDSLMLIDKAKKVLWWMSVDNYVSASGECDLDYIRENVDIHLFQSHYAKDYVEKKIPGANGLFLSDYINEEHGRFLYPAELRKNLAFYNPKKGYKDIEPLINKASWLTWVPLSGMKREQLILMMQSGKIYVDFGNHPGKDRIPREAAANGCCVITNKKGAANYHKDVPIDERFKFENPIDSLDEIDSLMKDICEHFSDYQKEFKAYRDMIKSEKAKFEEDLITFIEIIRN